MLETTPMTFQPNILKNGFLGEIITKKGPRGKKNFCRAYCEKSFPDFSCVEYIYFWKMLASTPTVQPQHLNWLLLGEIIITKRVREEKNLLLTLLTLAT